MMTTPPDRPDAPVCRLDPIGPGSADMPRIARLFTDPAVRRFLGGPVAEALSAQRAKEVVSLAQKAWAIRPSAAFTEPSLLGIVLLDRHHDGVDLEVSFLLLPEFWGQGYGSSAVSQVLTFAFETLRSRRILAETQTRNAASVRLLERLGFELLRSVIRFGAEQRIYGVDAMSFEAASTVRPVAPPGDGKHLPPP